MAFDKTRFCLHFSVPLSAQDWTNLQASGCKLVMLPIAFADTITLTRLNGMGCRLVIRVPEGQYNDDLAPGRIKRIVQDAQQFIRVAALLCGVEPENGVSFLYGSPTWAADKAYEHRTRFDAVRKAVQSIGVPVVSAGWTTRKITEDDKPQPGQITWAEIVRLSYDQSEGNAVHIYENSWLGPVDGWRFKETLGYWQSVWHQPLWVDEVGVFSAATSLERMHYYMDIANLLLTHPLGARVEMLAPFVCNGQPNGTWDPRWILSDPQCYVQLGNWLKA